MNFKTSGLDVYDGLSLVGFAAVLYGIAHWSPAAAWIVFGVVLCLAGSQALRKVKR